MVIRLKPFGMDIVKSSLNGKEKEDLKECISKLEEDNVFEVIDTEYAVMVKGRQKNLYRLLTAISYHYDIEIL